jgi:iron(III) transport system substrate-binding protein
VKAALAVMSAICLALSACSGARPGTSSSDGPDGPSAPATNTDGAATQTEQGTASGKVVIYTSVPEPIINELKAAFEQANPTLELEVFRAGTGDVQARVAVEQEGGHIGADLIWVAEPSAYESYKDQGILAQYSPPADAPIRESFIDPDGYYVAARVINMVVGWNTDEIPEGLSDWDGLLNHASRAVFPPPSSSGAALAAVFGIKGDISTDFFDQFAEAGGSQIASNGAARDAVISGEFAAAGALDYMFRAAKADGSPVDLAYPESGTVVIPSPIAISADAANPDGAKVFADYLLSQEGQRAVVEIGGFYPVRADVDPPEGAPSLDELTTIEVDWHELSQRTEEVNTYWARLFGG